VDQHWRQLDAGAVSLKSSRGATLRWFQRLERLAGRFRPIGWLAGRLRLIP